MINILQPDVIILQPNVPLRHHSADEITVPHWYRQRSTGRESVSLPALTGPCTCLSLEKHARFLHGYHSLERYLSQVLKKRKIFMNANLSPNTRTTPLHNTTCFRPQVLLRPVGESEIPCQTSRAEHYLETPLVAVDYSFGPGLLECLQGAAERGERESDEDKVRSQAGYQRETCTKRGCKQ